MNLLELQQRVKYLSSEMALLERKIESIDDIVDNITDIGGGDGDTTDLTGPLTFNNYNGILKANGNSPLTTAVAGTDFVAVNDSRLTNARTPTAHTHIISDITSLQSLLDGKENTLEVGGVTHYYRGDKTWQTLNKAAVGLPLVDNTADASKPVSTAQQAAIDSAVTTLNSTISAKAPIESPTFTGTVTAPSLIVPLSGILKGNGAGAITAAVAGTDYLAVGHTHVASDITEDVTHRFTTDVEKAVWNGKQNALVSGTSIKTINGTSVLGSGDIVISGGTTTTNAADLTSGTLNDARLSSNVALIAGTQTLTNKTISGASNNITDIPQTSITNLTTALAALAPTASPTFTGTVTTANLVTGLTGLLKGNGASAVTAAVAGTDYAAAAHTHTASQVTDFQTTARAAFSAGTGISITNGVIASTATSWPVNTHTKTISYTDTGAYFDTGMGNATHNGSVIFEQGAMYRFTVSFSSQPAGAVTYYAAFHILMPMAQIFGSGGNFTLTNSTTVTPHDRIVRITENSYYRSGSVSVNLRFTWGAEGASQSQKIEIGVSGDSSRSNIVFTFKTQRIM